MRSMRSSPTSPDRLLDAYRSAPPVPLPGIADAFAVLRDHDVKIVLQTGYSRAIAGPLLEQVDWRVGRDIDAVITSDQVRASRPAPYLIFHAMETVGVQSVSEVLVAGDTPNDLRAGANAGARYVAGVLTGAHDAATPASRTAHAHPDKRGDDSRGPRAAGVGDADRSTRPPRQMHCSARWPT